MANHRNAAREILPIHVGQHALPRESVHDKVSTLLGAEEELQRSAAGWRNEALQVGVHAAMASSTPLVTNPSARRRAPGWVAAFCRVFSPASVTE